MPDNNRRLRTPRLELRPAEQSDADFLHRLWTDPDVRRYLWDDNVVSIDEVRSQMERSLRDFEEFGFGVWVVALEEPIGFAALRHIEGSKDVELLYGLLPAHWGRGLATEAVRAIVEYGFEVCGLEQIFAGADPPNKASFAVMERLGMTFDRRTTIHGLEAIYYVSTRSQDKQAKET